MDLQGPGYSPSPGVPSRVNLALFFGSLTDDLMRLQTGEAMWLVSEARRLCRNVLLKVLTKLAYRNPDLNLSMVRLPKDVDPKPFEEKVMSIVDRVDQMELPDWVDIVKTSMFKELTPTDPDWYYIRAGRYTIMPSDIYGYWGLAQPQAPVPEPPVEYQTPVYQWKPEELTQQWHPQSEYPRAGLPFQGQHGALHENILWPDHHGDEEMH
ncbi:40S ribosomal protein S19 [Hordeum vulgare]|nr:40S ribosomal protein S19 [Hordeum vulgare]